jgi:exosortase A
MHLKNSYPLLLLAGISLASVAVFSPTWLAMANMWASTEDFSHGFLIPLISGWLVYRLLGSLPAPSKSGRILGLVCVALSLFTWIAGEVAGVGLVSKFGVIALVPSAFIALYGRRAAWILFFPLAFLFFMLPIGAGLTPLLMEWTADATIWALKISGIPVFRKGLFFELPTGNWSVVEACSGLRYLIAAIVLSTLFAYLNFTNWRPRLMFVVLASIIALVSNWLRAYLIVLLGHFSGMKIGVGDDHVVYGWVFFGVTMFAVFWLGMRWKDPSTGPVHAVRPNEAAPVKFSPTGLAWACVILGLMIFANAILGYRGQTLPRQDLDSLGIRTLEVVPEQQAWFQPNVKGTRWQGTRRAEGLPVHLSYFANQITDFEMIQHGNVIISSTGENSIRKLAGPTLITGPEASDRALKIDFERGNQRYSLAYWYTVCGNHTTSQYLAKGYQLKAFVQGCGDHSAISVVYWPANEAINQEQVFKSIRAAQMFAKSITSDL